MSLIVRKRKQWLLNTLLSKRIDVALLQETKLTSRHVEEASKFFENIYVFRHSCAISSSAGTAVLVRKHKGIAVFPDWETDQSGRVCAIDMLYQNDIFRVVAVHAPNQPAERKVFFINLRQYVSTSAATILGGDFNCVLNAKDSSRGIQQDSSIAELRKLLRDFDFQDVAEFVDSPNLAYTHWQGECHARLDRIYMSSCLAPATTGYYVSPVAFSDHALVATQIGEQIKGQKRPTSWQNWKLNDKALEDEDLQKIVKGLIANMMKNKEVNAANWELLKEEIKMSVISFCQAKALERRAEKRRLCKLLHMLVSEESKAPGLFAADIKECKARLLEILDTEYRGAMVRSRLRTLGRAEDPTKLFKTRERERASRNQINELMSGESTISEAAEIERELVSFYSRLFNQSSSYDQALVDKALELMPNVPEDVVDLINEDITEAEVCRAIKELAPRKSPGVDGLGATFYKQFSAELAPILAKVYADVHTRNLLPPSMRQALTVLIPKKKSDKSVRGCDDFRPISLLTTDYKILAKILAKRLEIAYKTVVGGHQTYGFKNRSITTNLHVMRIIAETAEAMERPTAVLQIDLKKAFDKVSHSFLFSILEHCKTGKYLLKFVKICYRDISTRLLINGCKSRRIPVRSSVRQGCPLSPILFAIYLEPLCRAIIMDDNIRGVKVGIASAKLLAYADDVSVVCSSQKEMVIALKHVNEFCVVSGAEMNPKKSAGSWLGPWPSKPETFLNIAWSGAIENYLGVGLSSQALSTGAGGIHLNTLRGKAIEWHGRQVPLLSRSFICNAVFFSTKWYSAQAVPCTNSDVQKMHRFCATYVWDSCFERMRRKNLFISKKKGGLGLVNVDIKLKVQRFLIFRDREKHPVMAEALRVLGGQYLTPWLEEAEGVPKKVTTLRYYREIRDAVRFFEQRFSWEYLNRVKRKRLYWDTLDLVMPPPIYRQMFPQCETSDVFKRLMAYPVRPGTKDFFVRFHTEVLPVKTWEQQKGFFLPWGVNCALCPVAETLEHTFLYCTNAELFWAELRAVLRVDLYPTWFDMKFLNAGEHGQSQCVEILTLIGLRAIWNSRTDHTLVRERGRPAWRHFLEEFHYVCSIIKETCFEEHERWEVLESCLK